MKIWCQAPRWRKGLRHTDASTDANSRACVVIAISWIIADVGESVAKIKQPLVPASRLREKHAKHPLEGQRVCVRVRPCVRARRESSASADAKQIASSVLMRGSGARSPSECSWVRHVYAGKKGRCASTSSIAPVGHF
eukprot:802200-Pleurochrysis_carterae.AAC.5